MITGKTRLVGVMGWPVSHTLSPAMQNAALRAAGLDAVYVPLAVAPERVGEAVRGLRGLGFVGGNVTVPHKLAVMGFLDELTPQARIVGAVNTIRVEADGRLTGHNTDCEGAIRAVQADGTTMAGRTVVVIGAGGAGRGAAAGAALAGAARVVILNRSVDRAESLVREFREVPDFAGVAWQAGELGGAFCPWEVADVVLQMSSLGMGGEGEVPWPPERLPDHAHVLDAVYHPLRTKFLEQAMRRGLRVTDGLAMLMEQGASAFHFWFGVEPDKSLMRAALARAAGVAE